MIGDSITDCGRSWPVGEGIRGLGEGYVALVANELAAACPDLRIRVLNMGISGDTARDLQRRWQQDVLALKTDWLSVMIGVNDAWRQFDSPFNTECQVYLDEYTSILQRLIASTLPSLSGLVLMTPFFVESDRRNPMRVKVEAYADVVRRLAREHQTVLVDTQAAFDELMVSRRPAELAWDRVHPTPAGHRALARAFMRALE